MKRPVLFLLLAAVVWVTAAGSAMAAGDLQCANCHDQPKTIVGTAHAAFSCLMCHPKHNIVPHPPGHPPPSCAKCHVKVSARNRLGVHGLARARGNEDAPDCEVCHGDVHEVKRTGTEAFRRSIPAICGQCHDTIYTNYEESVHGKAVARGIVAAPVCSSCHGEHKILAPSKSASPVHPTHIPQTCGRCHADVRITERFQLPRNPLISYEKSVHGLALRSGSQTVANCASCHGVHRILPSSDPRSTINPANLPHTCGKCHPGAGTRFAIGHIHWGEGAPPPLSVRLVRQVYWILIPLTIGLMGLHNAGDWVRKVSALRFGRSGVSDVQARAADTLGDPAYFRMYRPERIQHGVLVVSFTVLVWSGFALMYPDGWWAQPLVAWEGRWPVREIVHRTAGAVLIGLALFHVGSLVVSRTLRRHWLELRPTASDVPEAVGNFAYVLGLSRHRPKLSSHSYAEKLEYWAVIWGTAVMAGTGIMLWANTFVLTWLPMVTIDVALAIHFYEAVLATLAIVVWHFYMVLFDPVVYPMDPAWIRGYSVRKRDAEETEDADGEGSGGRKAPRDGTADKGKGKAPPW